MSLQKSDNPALFARQVKQIAEQNRPGWRACDVTEYTLDNNTYWLVMMRQPLLYSHVLLTRTQDAEGWFLCVQGERIEG